MQDWETLVNNDGELVSVAEKELDGIKQMEDITYLDLIWVQHLMKTISISNAKVATECLNEI